MTEGEDFKLDVYYCEKCSFRIGFDTTYLQQVGPINARCPACGTGCKVEKIKPDPLKRIDK